MIGSRRSSHFTNAFCGWKVECPLMEKPCSSRCACARADPDLRVGDELVGRQRQVGGRGPAADAPRGVVLRAVAGTEIAAEVALMRDRDAAEMRADADQDLPLVVAGLDALVVGLGVGQARQVDRARLV